MSNNLSTQSEKFIGKKEFVLYLVATFFYTNMTGMVGNYRQNYLVDILGLENKYVSFINLFCGIACFALSFLYAIVIDNRKNKKNGKFKPIGIMAAVPCGLFCVLMFVTPNFSERMFPLMIAYLCIVAILQHASNYFGNSINMVAIVMTPNTRERDSLLSFRGIANAIGNSAPLVIVLVVGLIKDKTALISTQSAVYIVSAVVCAVVGTITMLIGMKTVSERTAYSKKRENPLLGYKDVVGNKYARLVMLSEFLKSFRGIATYMGIFLAVALLGSPSKYILFGLPTGIGTFIGMLIVNALLKKFSAKQIYIGSGVYSVIANLGAFAVGLLYFNNSDHTFYTIIFFAFLFLIGLQFGASNLLPSMFQADILEDLELKTQKRLDAALPFVIGIGSTLSGLIASSVAPLILYGSNSIIHYIQPINEVYQVQPYETKVKLLFFYTIFHGIMMLLAGVPFIFYKLTGKEKERVHNEVLKNRAEWQKSDTDE